MKKKILYIFDLDGTIVNAYKAIEESLNFTRQKLGYPKVSYQEVKRKVGRGDKIFIANFFQKEDIEKALEIYRKHHKKSVLIYSKAMPYARWLLYNLKRKKKKIAIASNRPKYYTNLILKKLGLNKYIDYVLCADEIKTLKPNPKILNLILKEFNIPKDEAVFIGDMDIDLETAKRAGIDAIFIKGGSSPLSEVKGYKKTIVSCLKDIISLDRGSGKHLAI